MTVPDDKGAMPIPSKMAFSHYSSSLPCLFPVFEEMCTIDFDVDENVGDSTSSKTPGISAAFEQCIAAAVGQTLTIVRSPAEKQASFDDVNNYDLVLAEMDFDANLTTLAWDVSGRCLVVADISGTIHIVKSDGTVLFSKKVFPGSNDLYLVMLQFQHDPCHENNQELVGVLSNGNVLMMSNINVDGLCSSADSGTLAQILKVAKFSNFKLSLDSNGVRKAVLIPFDPNHPVDTLQIIVLDTKYQLRSFIMDLSVTQPDGGFVGQSLSFVGLVCSFHLLVLAQQYYVVGLQTKGSIVIANLNTLNSIAEYHIGQKLDGIVSVKVVSVNESFHGISLAVKSTAAKAIYLQTILVSNLPSQATAFVIPHGHEVITNTNVAMSNIFSNGLPLGTLDRVLTLGQKELGIYSLGSVSQLLFREILQVSFSATVNLQALENSNISFGMILGTFVHIFCSSSQHRNDGLLQSLLRACSKRRFASEIIQLASLLLDNNSLEDTLTEQLLTECQNQLNATAVLDAGKLESAIIVQRWQHYRNVASRYRQQYAVSEQNSAVVTLMKQFLPASIGDYVDFLLKLGSVDRILFLLDRNISVQFNHPVAQIHSKIPSFVGAVELIQFTQRLIGLVQKQQYISWSSTVFEEPTLQLTSSYLPIIRELFDRANEIATDLEHSDPPQCLSLVLFTLSLIDLLSDTANGEIIALRDELLTMEKNVRLQIIARDVLHIEVSYEEVQHDGLAGIVFERLHNVFEDELVAYVNDKLKYVVKIFDQPLDDLLTRWLEDTVESCLIVSGIEQHEDDENFDVRKTNAKVEAESTCHLSRLIRVVSCMENKAQLAKALLKIFQLPSLEVMIESNANGSQHLTSLAVAMYEHVELKTKDQLTEAVRLFHIRLLANQYNVEHFDVRDHQHLLATISIIASTSSSPTALRDAISFAMDGSHLRIDVQSILLRALIRFVQECDVEILSYEQDLKVLIDYIPNRAILRNVCEDFVTFAMEEVNSLTKEMQASHAKGSATKDVVVRQRKDLMIRLTKASIKMIEIFLDAFDRNHNHSTEEVSNTSVGTTSKLVRSRQDQKDRKSLFCNTSVLLDLKRLYQLQTVYQICTFSMQDLRKSSACKALVEQLSSDAVQQWIQGVPQEYGNVLGEQKTTLLYIEELLPLQKEYLNLKRICGILNIATQIVLHSISKRLIVNGRKQHALAFHRINLELTGYSQASHEEDSNMMSSSSVTSQVNRSGHHASKRSYDLTVDSATLLCQAALKNDKTNSGYGYYAQTSSTQNDIEFELEAYKLSQTLLQNAILDCEPAVLTRALDALNITDTILKVYDRIEQNNARSNEGNTTSNNQQFNALFSTSSTTEGVFTRDGLLMQQENILPSLTNFCIHELKRRSQHKGSNASSNLADVEQFLTNLQKHENHLVALHVLYRSWGHGALKSQLLRSSILALSRKILTYREIDVSFSVACLSALPLDATVKELKAAVPSIQSDFSRLQTVAMIGEEIAHLWDVEDLLLLFQSLQTNAKWWHTLVSLGLSIDLKLFKSADAEVRQRYVESLIPDMLRRNGYDLEMANEYCRSFDIEPEIAALSYIELMLLQDSFKSTAVANAGSTSSHQQQQLWVTNIKAAAAGISEQSLIATLKRVVEKINPLDYEKICFTCSWLMDLLPLNTADMDEEHNRSQEEDEEGMNTCHEDASTYQLYLDVCNFLSSTPIPVPIMTAIRADAHFITCYAHAHGSYLGRLPVWNLIQQPWTIFDPIFDVSTEFAEKLLPLCFLLGLDKEEFNARSIFATYRQSSSDAISSSGIVDMQKLQTIMGEISHHVAERLLRPISKVKLWQWIYEREKQDHKSVAILASQKALQVLSGVGDDTGSALLTMKTDFQEALQKLQLECSMLRFATCFPNAEDIISALKPLIVNGAVENLMKHSLELIVEYAWELQVESVSSSSTSPLTTATMSHIRPMRSVFLFMDKVAPMLREMSQHSAMSVDVGDDQEQLSKGWLDSLLSQFTIKILTDFGFSTNLPSSASPTESNASTSINNDAKSIWQLATSSPNLNVPTMAECRRREDLFMGFSLLMLLLLSPSSTSRQAQINTLESIVRATTTNVGITSQGNATSRTMRRFTGRSRFRAAQALLHFPFHVYGDNTLSSHINDLPLYTTYLYCLSEMQEIRLSSSEESLMDAIGISYGSAPAKQGSGTVQILQSVPSSASSAGRSLIMTWLHDEGQHMDVVELARDLFYFLPNLSINSYSSDRVQLLNKIVAHLIEHRLSRPLQQFLVMLMESSPIYLEDLMYHHSFCKDILEANLQMMVSATEKLTTLKLTSDSASNISKLWKSVIYPSPVVNVASGGSHMDSNSSILHINPTDLNNTQISVLNTGLANAPKVVAKKNTKRILLSARDHRLLSVHNANDDNIEDIGQSLRAVSLIFNNFLTILSHDQLVAKQSSVHSSILQWLHNVVTFVRTYQEDQLSSSILQSIQFAFFQLATPKVFQNFKHTTAADVVTDLWTSLLFPGLVSHQTHDSKTDNDNDGHPRMLQLCYLTLGDMRFVEILHKSLESVEANQAEGVVIAIQAIVDAILDEDLRAGKNALDRQQGHIHSTSFVPSVLKWCMQLYKGKYSKELGAIMTSLSKSERDNLMLLMKEYKVMN